MKTLILIRHAKSDWAAPAMADYDRGLNSRGSSDAAMMGERLQQRLSTNKQQIEVFLSSSAQRAAQTTRLLSTPLHLASDTIDWRRELYLASPHTMLEIIRTTPSDVNSLALLAHNPGITELAEKLTGEFLGNVPTCGVITIAIPIDDWCDTGNWADLIDFDFPKRPA